MSDDAKLLEKLRAGVEPIGMDEDTQIELFDVEGASDIMFTAAERIEALTAYHTSEPPMSDEIKALVERAILGAKLIEDGFKGYPAGIAQLLKDVSRALTAQADEIERLRAALIEEREDNLWEAYNSGNVKDGQWTHMFMSDGEWLARECGFNPSQGHYDDAEIRAAIPRAALKAAQEVKA